MNDGSRQVGRGAISRNVNSMRGGEVSRRGGSRGLPRSSNSYKDERGLGSEGDVVRRIAEVSEDMNGEERSPTMLICENWLEIDSARTRTNCRYNHPNLCYGTCNNRNCEGIHRAEAKRMLVGVRRERERG